MRCAAWIAVVLLAVLGPPALAQPRRGGAPPSGPAERREQVKKKIRAMRAYTLTEELVLDEQTAGRLFPVLSRYDDETDKLLEKRIDIQRRLRRASSIHDARTLDRLIDEAVANQRGFWDLEDRRLTELRKILTPTQTAKLLVVLPALERRIQNQLRRAIVLRHPENSPDLDDDQEPDELPAPPRPPRGRREAPLAPRGSAANTPGNTPPCDPAVAPCR